MKKLWATLILTGLLIGLVIFDMSNHFLFLSKPLRPKTEYNQTRVVTKSKAEIVAELNQTISTVRTLEKTLGRTGPQGYKVYAPNETGRLIKQYQDLIKLDHYLNQGNWKININQWEGYSLSPAKNKPYESAQVVQVMDELAHTKVLWPFVDHLKIFLLPFAIPDVSGLGGKGYIMLSARAVTEDLIENQFAVTLYHEIGHHVNFTFMPKDTLQGERLWKNFLQIRGGTWHGPGSVKTKAWSESSEETFAEDFRMLFGQDQPFFGDLVLGDPRVDPEKSKKEKQFMTGLAMKPADHYYQSPWLPEQGLWFWQLQDLLVISGWLLMILIIIIYNLFTRTVLDFQERDISSPAPMTPL